jgi:hypothetical protein
MVEHDGNKKAGRMRAIFTRHSGMRLLAQTRNPEMVRDFGFALTRAPGMTERGLIRVGEMHIALTLPERN